MAKTCTHQKDIKKVKPSGKGCKECLEMHDTWVSVRKAVAALDAELRPLCELLLEGRTLRAAARSLGISYATARRRWKKLRRRLKAHLRDLPETP